MVFEFEKKLSNYSWYRWVLLASTCMCQLLGIGYMPASVNIYPIYYEDWFGDRKLAGQIGSVGISLSFLACKWGHQFINNTFILMIYYITTQSYHEQKFSCFMHSRNCLLKTE